MKDGGPKAGKCLGGVMLVPSVSLADLSQLPSQVFLPSSPHWLLDAPNYVLLALRIMPPPLY